MVQAHEDDHCASQCCAAPVDSLNFVSCDEGNDGSVIAMRQRDSGVRSNSQRRGHSRDNFEGNSCVDETLHFFPAPPEDEWISTLEANNRQTLTCTFHEHVDDLVLA